MSGRRPGRNRTGPMVIAWAAVLVCLAGSGEARAQSAMPWKISGAADWSILQSDATLDGTHTQTTLFQQKYSVDLSGIIWDPRFSHFTVGLDLTDSSQNSDEFDQDTRGIGYRAQASFFPSRPFPLTVYGRRSAVEATGSALARADRETDAWGGRWALLDGGRQNFSLQYDRSSFDLIAPLPLKERRSTGVANYDRRHERGEFNFRYGYLDRGERVNDTQFTRHNFSVSERTRLGEITTLRMSGQSTSSDAVYTSGQTDELQIYRVAATVDLDPADGPDTMVSYNFNDNRGRFVDSISHAVRTRSRFRMGENWQSTVGVHASDLQSRSDTASGDTEQRRAGAHGSVRYSRGWDRASLSTGYGIGYSRETFSRTPDTTTASHAADIGARFQLTRRSDLSGSVSAKMDDSDQTGTAYSYDEVRGTLRWAVRMGGGWEMSSSVLRRYALRETISLGTQESTETTVDATLNHPVAGFTLAWSRIEGLSELLPDPASGSPFTPGSDTVSEQDTLSFMAHWRPSPFLRMSMLARGEYRDFSTFDKEEYFTFQPEVYYDRNTWTVSTSYTHYERQNGIDYVDDTWALRVTKRFY